MLSLSDAISFSFCKRSFILGSILLFILVLSIFGLGELFLYMVQHNVIPNEQNFRPLGYVLYSFQLFGYAILFSYLFIRAKQDVYDLLPKFSGEFFIRVCLTFFALSVLSGVGIYYATPYIQKFIMNSTITLMMSYPFPWNKFIFKILLPALGCSLLVGYLWSSVYMAYVMHFSFYKFGYKFLQVLKHPLIFLEIVCWGILFLIVTYLPVFAIYWILKNFGQDVMSSFTLSSAGSNTLPIPLILLSVVFGAPVTFICLKTETGRLTTLLFTLLYFMIYGLILFVYRQTEIPLINFSIPITAMIYVYIFFYLLCLLFIITSIILPTGLIHLMVQGTFHIHKSFEPEVDKHPLSNETEENIPTDRY